MLSELIVVRGHVIRIEIPGDFRKITMRQSVLVVRFIVWHCVVAWKMVLGKSNLFKSPGRAKPNLVKTPVKKVSLFADFVCRVCFSGLCNAAKDSPYKCEKILNSRYSLFKDDFHQILGQVLQRETKI